MNKSPPAQSIRLLVSDVDGTLVKTDKTLTQASIDAVARLRAAGIEFAIVSSRPPRGMLKTAEALGITSMFAGFNGGEIVKPDLTPVEQHFVPREAVETSIRAFEKAGVSTWVFANGDWIITDPNGDYVPLEQRTVGFPPRVVSDFTPFLGQVGKIVGASKDFAMLARLEDELHAQLGKTASAHRSQQYYLDVNNVDANKGTAARALSSKLGITLAETACIGDMTNDIPMLSIAGLAIAMANGPAEVKTYAHEVTSTNDDDGFAQAVDRFILPRAAKGSRA